MDAETRTSTCPPTLWPLVQALREWPEVRVLRLGGSVARGQADHLSDVEFYAACTRVPPLDRRHQFILRQRDLGTAFFLDEAALWGVLDTFCGAGRSVTVVFQEVATMERGLVEVLAASDLDREKEMAFGQEIIDAEILYDPHGLAANWQAWAQAYPAARQAGVWRGLAHWQQQIALELAETRDDPLWAAYRLQETWEWLAHGLCALHGRYYVGPKRAMESLATFVERPPDTLACLSESWQTDLSPRALHAVWQQVSAEVLAEGKTPGVTEYWSDGAMKALLCAPLFRRATTSLSCPPTLPEWTRIPMGWPHRSEERALKRIEEALKQSMEEALARQAGRDLTDLEEAALVRAFHQRRRRPLGPARLPGGILKMFEDRLEKASERSEGALSQTLEMTLRSCGGWRSTDPEQAALLRAFHRGCDCAAERLYVAAHRGDATGFLFYQQKTLEALAQVLWPLQGWTWPGALTRPPGTRPFRSLRPAPPALYDRLCGLWAGSYRREALREKRRQWLELWSELVPLIYQRYPTVDLRAGEQALDRALRED